MNHFNSFRPALDKFLLLTGPNMGGKSTFLRQNALIILMAQCGSFVPASNCSFTPIDAIFTRIGASDDLSRDKSTFMLEMSETAHILRHATPHSLVLIDEIGRGTSAAEGLALAASIADHLINCNQSHVLFATHYHEIAACSLLSSVDSIQMACTEALVYDDGSVVLIPKVKPGLATHSYALPVASLAGIPASVIKKATKLLSK
jgi:DNA mismatch repair protein MutS